MAESTSSSSDAFDQYLVDVDCFKFRSRISSLSSYLCNNVDVLEQLTERLFKQGILSNEELDEVLKTPSGDNEKALSLTKAIVVTLKNSHKPLPNIIDELRKFEDLNDIVDTMTLPDVTDEEVDVILKEIEEKMIIKIEEFEEELEDKMRKKKAMIVEKLEEIGIQAFGDKSALFGPITTPRYSTDPNATVEDHLEWIKSEFDQLSRQTAELKENSLRFKEKVDKECDKIMENMDKRGEKFDRDIANAIRLAEERSKKIVDYVQTTLSKSNQRFKDLEGELREYHNERKKLHEEMFDRTLKRERQIEAIDEALESDTCEIKVEKSYKSGLLPKWTHPSLIKTSCTVTPVYRTIEEFEENKKNSESIILEPFYTSRHGYKMIVAVYPNGQKGSHVSVAISLMKGDNDNVLLFPFSGNIIIKVLNWTKDNGHVGRIIQFDESKPLNCRQRVIDGEMATYGWGYDDFLSHVAIMENNTEYLHNDKMCLIISYEPIQQIGSPFPSWYINNNPANIIPPCIITMYQYSLYKNANSQWSSTPFYSARGYKLQLTVYPNGDGGTHLSFCVRLLKGGYDDELQWPFNARITIQLLNWSSDSKHFQCTIDHYTAPVKHRTRVIESPDVGWGGDYVSHSLLNANNYIYEDKLCFKIVCVDIIN